MSALGKAVLEEVVKQRQAARDAYSAKEKVWLDMVAPVVGAIEFLHEAAGQVVAAVCDYDESCIQYNGRRCYVYAEGASMREEGEVRLAADSPYISDEPRWRVGDGALLTHKEWLNQLANSLLDEQPAVPSTVLRRPWH